MTTSHAARAETALLAAAAALILAACAGREAPATEEEALRPSEYVSTFVGTMSSRELSAGNTYPAVALPWGMNFWTPQTGRNGDGWTYTYAAHTLRGLKQTHQPSPWIGDYGQFSLMPTRGRDKVDEEARQSWFSHQGEEARPYYYSVYLADHDVLAELTPTDRAAMMRFTFPATDEAGVVIDAYDGGSALRLLPDRRTVCGWTSRNSGGVPAGFRNWFVVRFDRDIDEAELYDGDRRVGGRASRASTPWPAWASRRDAARGSWRGWRRRSSRRSRPCATSASWATTTSRPSAPRRNGGGTTSWGPSR